MTASGSDSRALLARPTFLLSAAVLALVAFGGVTIALSGPEPAQARPRRDGGASAAPTTAPGSCSPADTDQEKPDRTPADLTWQMFGPWALPYSKTAGPMIVDGGVARCFAHTPLGAALATAHIAVRMQAGDDAPRVSLAQAMPGPGRDRWIEKLYDEGVLDLTSPQGTAQLGGFRIVSFTPQHAVVESATTSGGDQVRVFTFTLAWDGDWKLLLQPEGTLSPAPHQAGSSDGTSPDTEGFVRWRLP